MKKPILFKAAALLAMVVFGAVSCGDDEKLVINMEAKEVTIPEEGGEASLQLDVPSTWSLQIVDSWLSAKPDNGKPGSYEIVFSAAPNVTGTPRSSVVTVKAAGADPVQLTVTQGALDLAIAFAESGSENSGFKDGDMIGLFAGAPMNLTNEKLTWKDGKLTAEKALFFAAGKTGKTKFTAYYPYNPELKTTSFKFEVKADQREAADYSAGDLLIASAEAGPLDGGVPLQFSHKMSKLVLTLDNKAGEMIKDVLISGIAPAASVDLDKMSVGAASGRADDLFFRPIMVAGEGFSSVASLLFPPQTVRELKVVVILESGKTFRFNCEGGEYVSGKQYAQTLTIENPEFASEEYEFILKAVDWEEGGEMRFSNAQMGARAGWRLAFFPANEEDGRWIVLTETLPGEFLATIKDYRQGDCFQLASENNTRIYFGCTLMIPQRIGAYDNCWPISFGGRWELADYEGLLNVWFYPDEGIVKYETL